MAIEVRYVNIKNLNVSNAAFVRQDSNGRMIRLDNDPTTIYLDLSLSLETRDDINCIDLTKRIHDILRNYLNKEQIGGIEIEEESL